MLIAPLAARSNRLEEQAAAVHSQHRGRGGLPHEVQVSIIVKIIYFVKRFIYLLHPIKGLRTKQLGPSIPSTSGLSEHYLCLCSLFIHKISILIQNMMKICKACNKPFSHLISQFHTSEEIVETILHFTTNINIYKHFREISPMFVKY